MLIAKRFGCTAFWSIALLLAACQVAVAQQAENQSTSEAAVRQASTEYLAAMASRDAKKIADFWTADGTYTDEHNDTFKARDLITSSFATAKSSAPPMKLSDVSVRLVTADVAIEEGNCETKSPGAMTPIPGRFSALWVRQNGKWKLDHLRESRTVAPVVLPQTAAEEVAVLDPFVGEWAGTSGKLQVKVSANWNAAKTFLHREVAITSEGKPVFSGSQEIGWDPRVQSIKSWTFNGDGGLSEAQWSLEGNCWMMHTAGVTADDAISENTQTCKFPDKNTLLWKIYGREIGNEPLPDLEISLKRKS